MITRPKLNVYLTYSGYSDEWERMGSAQEKSIISYSDWHQIDDLRERICFAASAPADQVQATALERLLTENCESLEVREGLQKFALKYCNQDPANSCLVKGVIYLVLLLTVLIVIVYYY
ncbi:hypothetical protein [Hymenobacter arizonensis]|uniref:Uncharacterized protein n=1 Tax=Hymenobacter arizonensis TaxID=1227077 RepID=A0A1I6BP11_HYMAR|nr:hypothetical protein [Hymenobacter arizonensis]SFQ82624.1 hypothetical protein SAMN04515668_4848 [Hymenobacter arizonensis]